MSKVDSDITTSYIRSERDLPWNIISNTLTRYPVGTRSSGYALGMYFFIRSFLSLLGPCDNVLTMRKLFVPVQSMENVLRTY